MSDPDTKPLPVHILFSDGKEVQYYMLPEQRDALVRDFVAFRCSPDGLRAGSYDGFSVSSTGSRGLPAKLGVFFPDVRFIG